MSDDYRDPMLVEEYEKYRFDMLEQGLEPMSFEQFRREALAGMAKATTRRSRRNQREKSNIPSRRRNTRIIGGLRWPLILRTHK